MKAVAHENYKTSALGRFRKLASTISFSKKLVFSKLCKIAQVAYLGEITIIGSGHARKLKRSAPSRAGIFVCTICYSKKVAVS